MLQIEPIETPRLRLSELSEADASFLLALMNDPGYLQHIGDRGVRNEADALRYLLDGPVCSYRRHGHGLLRMALKDSGVPVGLCGLLKRDALNDVDLGYALLPRYRGMGYVHEAAQAVLQHAHRSLGILRVLAVVAPGNVGSEGVLLRLGFQFERQIILHPSDALLRLFARDATA